MIDLTTYILNGLSVFPKKSVTINGTVIEALFNQSTHRDNKTFGGYENEDEAVLYIETSKLTNPRSLKGKTLTLDNRVWRIITVRYGDYVTHLTIISAEAL